MLPQRRYHPAIVGGQHQRGPGAGGGVQQQADGGLGGFVIQASGGLVGQQHAGAQQPMRAWPTDSWPGKRCSNPSNPNACRVSAITWGWAGCPAAQ